MLILSRKISWLPSNISAATLLLSCVVSSACGSSTNDDGTPTPGTAGAKAADDGPVVCVYSYESWTTCTDGVTTTSQEWECVASRCGALQPVGETVFGSCFGGGAKTDRVELPGDCAEYLPPGATTPRFPQPEVDLRTDPEVLSACLRAAERDERCGESTIDPNCEHFAQVESTDAIALYAEIAATPCGERAELELTPTDVGDRICREIAANCPGELPPEWCTLLNEATAWMRTDVQEAVEVCFTRPSCEGMAACIDVWTSAVWPEPAE